jgi:hypothetical protein
LPDEIFFKPKIPIWVNFGVSCNERCWKISWSFDLLGTYTAILYNLWPFM